MDILEYGDIQTEIKGAISNGKLKITDQNIIYKNSKTGKVEQISGADIDAVNWQRHIGNWGIRLFTKNGNLYRFIGFKDQDQDKLAKFFKKNYDKEMLEKELSLKGWNWGTAKFLGSALSFEMGSLTAFEIPLNSVSQCTTGKNEVTLEYHQNDEVPVSLLEMRFHIPSSELAGDDAVEQFQQNVMNKASVISAVGDAIAIFREIQCLTPRGRYDIKVFPSFFQLHGKTFDYKIPMSTVLRLFILPHKDGRQMFFVASLDPPIKQGQTRYHFLVFSFGPDEETNMELPLSEEELKEKFEGKLPKELNGPTCEVLSKVMKCMTGRKITMPNSFVGHSGTPAIGCSYKAAAGYLYPLERGFIYVHKPPVHIRFEEITSVNFARSGGSTRSFDFEIDMKAGIVHTFSSIEKDEYTKLYDFIQSKKLHIKNKGKADKPNYADDFGDSDQEDAPDAYLARVKREAKERDDDDDGSEDESEDEDFKPTEEASDVAEEFDSNVSTSDSDSDASEGTKQKKKEEKLKKKEKKERKKTVSEKPRKKKEKKEDDGKPKRPMTAFMLWINQNREDIKKKYPGIGVTDVAKKGGEMWRELTDKSEWDAKATQAKADYEEAMKEYRAGGGGGGTAAAGSSKPSKKASVSKTASPNKTAGSSGAGANYKSKEYLSDDDDSSDDGKKSKASKPSAKKAKKDGGKKDTSKKDAAKKDDSEGDKSAGEKSSEEEKKRKKPSKKETPKKKTGKKSSDEEELEDEEEILSSPTASEDSGDDSD